MARYQRLADLEIDPAQGIDSSGILKVDVGTSAISTDPNPARRGTLTDRSGTVTVGGTAQNLAAINANRKYLLVYNPLTAAEQGIGTAETLWINFTTAAVTARPSIPLEPGQSFVFESAFVSTELVSVIAATTAHAFIAKEG